MQKWYNWNLKVTKDASSLFCFAQVKVSKLSYVIKVGEMTESNQNGKLQKNIFRNCTRVYKNSDLVDFLLLENRDFFNLYIL